MKISIDIDDKNLYKTRCILDTYLSISSKGSLESKIFSAMVNAIDDDFNSFENVIGTIKSKKEYLEAKKKLRELYECDPTNPAEESSWNMEVKTLRMKIAEYEKRMKSNKLKIFNKEQCSEIMSITCYILDSTSEVEDRLKAAGIDESDLKKVSQALDLINEVNQKYEEIKTRLEK